MKSLEDGLSGFFMQLEMCKSALGVRDAMLWFGYELYPQCSYTEGLVST